MQGAAWLLGDERGRTFAVEAPSYDKRNQLVTGARLLGLGCDLQIVNDGPAFQATKPGGLLSIFRTYAVDESLVATGRRWRSSGRLRVELGAVHKDLRESQDDNGLFFYRRGLNHSTFIHVVTLGLSADSQ